jgi:hypothetical protein
MLNDRKHSSQDREKMQQNRYPQFSETGGEEDCDG